MPLPTFRHEAMTTYFEIVIAGQPEDYARQATDRKLDFQGIGPGGV